MVVKQQARAAARILVIDDDDALLHEAINVLYVSGYEVETHGRGMSERLCAVPKALAESVRDPVAVAVDGEFDVVIMDTAVPGVDPFVLINSLQSSESKPVIILMAEEPQREMVIAALRGGAFEFLLKPFSTDRLLEAIHQGLDNRRAFFQILNLSRRLEEVNRACALERDHLAVSNQTLRRLTECVQEVSAALTTEEMIQALTKSFSSIISYDRVSLVIFQDNACWVHVPSATDDALTCHTLAIQGDSHGATIPHEQGEDTVHDVGTNTEVSLHVLDHQIGFMTLHRRDRSQLFTPQELDLLTMVGNSVSLAIRNVETHRRVQTLAVTDGLTGLLNHRAFSNILNREFIKTKRYQKPLSLIMMDVDNFKAVNDQYGHQAGDQTLREFARLCSEVVRDIDIVVRYGGDEFAVILPDTELRQAMTVAERIHDAIIAQCSVEDGRHTVGLSRHAPDPSTDQAPGLLREREHVSGMGFTISMGIASCPRHGIASADDLVSEADKALYMAKAGGRNRTQILEHEAEEGDSHHE